MATFWIFSKVIKRWWGKLRSPGYRSHSFKFLCDVSALKSEKVQLVACGRNHTLICTGQCLVVTAVFFQVLMNIKHACVDVCLQPKGRCMPQVGTAKVSWGLETVMRGRPSRDLIFLIHKDQSRCLLRVRTPQQLSPVRSTQHCNSAISSDHS